MDSQKPNVTSQAGARRNRHIPPPVSRAAPSSFSKSDDRRHGLAAGRPTACGLHECLLYTQRAGSGMRRLEPQSETGITAHTQNNMVVDSIRQCGVLINRMTRRSIKVRSGGRT